MAKVTGLVQAHAAIQRWFDENNFGGLILPDGWFGRPYDSMHVLTSIEEHGNELELVLDTQVFLRFEGLKTVDNQGKRLLLGPFDSLVFQAKINPPLEKVYAAGHVELVTL